MDCMIGKVSRSLEARRLLITVQPARQRAASDFQPHNEPVHAQLQLHTECINLRVRVISDGIVDAR